MSKRIGLIHIQQMYRSLCPSGEQITNGGLETGDFTGWTRGGYSQPSISNVAHTGNYSAYFGYDYMGRGGYMEQSFKEITYKCIKTWTLWARSADENYGDLRITVSYEEGGSTTWRITTDINQQWQQFDIKAQIDSTKTPNKIRITRPDYSEAARNNVDDISLIGKG